MSKKKVILVSVLVFVIAIIFALIGTKSYLEKNLQKIVNATVSDVDLSSAKDGVYTGSFNAFPVVAEVKVTISNHKIAVIELVKHDNGKGTAAEVLPQKVVEAQSIEVDAVTGATYSSKVILKAIENALNEANK